MNPATWDRRTLKSILGFLTITSFIFPLYYLVNWIEIFSYSDNLIAQEKVNIMQNRFLNSFSDVKSIAKAVLISLIITVNLSLLWLNTFKRRGPRPPYITLGIAIVLLIFSFVTMVSKIQ